ncbi:MAG TPA: DNA repair protein RecO [Blastocatellia bacterium]|nr:DNA repair protein RecO [Blastocatellia bacterium]
MSLHRTEAFVLRTYSLKEADKICVFFTREQGKIRGVAHGARKIRSRFGSSLEPFTEVTLGYFQKEGRELISISTCDIVRSHFERGARDVETASAFSYMAELLTEFLPEHEANEKIYRLVLATLEAIEAHPDVSQILRYFETWLLKLVGFFPDTSNCAGCDEQIPSGETVYLASDGAPRCVACSGGKGVAIDPHVRAIILEMFRVHPAAFGQNPLTREHASKIGEINYQIIRHALERDLRSRSALKESSTAGK